MMISPRVPQSKVFVVNLIKVPSRMTSTTLCYWMLETLNICEITDEEESPNRTHITSVHIIKERLNFWCDCYDMGDLPLFSTDGSACKQYLNCAPKWRNCQKWRPLPSAFYTSTDFLTQQVVKLYTYTHPHILFC